MYAFYMSLQKPAGSHTENNFSIWRSHNHNVRINLNQNKLGNVQRDIINKKRLTDIELREIKEKVIPDLKDIDSGNVGIRDGDVDDRDEGTGSTSCTDADTRVVKTRHVDQRENVNHNGTLDDISTDEGFGVEFELVDEDNHNVSYDTTGNNIIIPVSMKIVKLTVTLKNKRMIKLEKKTIILSIFLFETQLLRLSKKLKLLV